MTESSEILQKTVRNHSEAMVVYALAPDFEIPEAEIAFYERFLEIADFDKAVCYWPLLCAFAWWTLRAREEG